MTPEFKARYPDFFGRYRNIRPDFSRCCTRVSDGNFGLKQCSRPNGHGPDGAYCKQHDPEAVRKKYESWSAKIHEESRRTKALNDAKDAVESALRQIAEGHNDAQQLARDVIAALDAARR